MAIFFTSDLHLGHANIDKYCARGFDAKAVASGRPDRLTDLMNLEIVDSWNSVVQPSDRVFVLGDVAMGDSAERLSWVHQLHGFKVLVPGNHDTCWPYNKKTKGDSVRLARNTRRYLSAGFAEVDTDPAPLLLPSLLGAGHTVELSHFPYAGDSTREDRYPEARPEFRGLPLLCGHLHDVWRVELYKGVVQINVGLDAWNGYPVSMQQILEILDTPVAGLSEEIFAPVPRTAHWS